MSHSMTYSCIVCVCVDDSLQTRLKRHYERVNGLVSVKPFFLGNTETQISFFWQVSNVFPLGNASFFFCQIYVKNSSRQAGTQCWSGRCNFLLDLIRFKMLFQDNRKKITSLGDKKTDICRFKGKVSSNLEQPSWSCPCEIANTFVEG